jgi:hypothetical protein
MKNRLWGARQYLIGGTADAKMPNTFGRVHLLPVPAVWTF